MIKKIRQVDIKNIGQCDLVLDIETTGFSPEYSKISTIGYILFKQGCFSSVQLFSETGDDKEILQAFLKDLKSYHRIISFNGLGFDIPFIVNRLKKNGLDFDIANLHLDIYSYMKDHKEFSPYPPMGQKKLEQVLGIERESDLDGKKAVDMYKSYLKTRDTILLDKLLYYNYLDIYNLSKLYQVYLDIRNEQRISPSGKDFYIKKVQIKKDQVIIDLETQETYPYPIDLINSSYRLVWDEYPRIYIGVSKGLIGPSTSGIVYNSSELEGLVDLSAYKLLENLILVSDGSLMVKNIKNIAQAILSDSFNSLEGHDY